MIQKTSSGQYIFPRLQKFSNIIHAISTVDFGDMNIKRAENVSNIKRYAEEVGVSYNKMIFMQQEHTNKTKEVHVEKKYVYKKVDSLVTTKKVALNVATADCVPIIFFDPTTKTIAVAHSGWRGTYKNIAKNVLRRFSGRGIDVQNVIVALGPAIRSCCYSIDRKRACMFSKKYPKWKEGFLLEKDNTFFINLPSLIKKQLQESGIKEENIDDANICTYDSQDFFSFRKQQNRDHTKVFITSIGLI
jgi:polyphenol oxidase